MMNCLIVSDLMNLDEDLSEIHFGKTVAFQFDLFLKMGNDLTDETIRPVFLGPDRTLVSLRQEMEI